jgi:hypothetical protein
MRNRSCIMALAMLGLSTVIPGCLSSQHVRGDAARPGAAAQGWVRDFAIRPDDLTATGRNQFFILEPGYQLVLEGGDEKATITVLHETEMLGGVTARVVEEREEKGGKLSAISRNYFAISKTTGDVFYFGEDAGGAWRAYQVGAKPGLIMPGKPAIGMKYYQEVAPGKAMDRAEVVTLTATLKTPAGVFTGCLRTRETTELEPKEEEYKTYAPGIGLIQDQDVLLTQHGFVKEP